MKGVRKRLLAVLLSCFVLIISVAGKCQVVGATSVVGPTTAGGISAAQTLEFLYSVLMSMGITLNLKEMIRYHDPADGYTWLDDPASQKQIDEVNDKIGEYYDNAVKDWYEKHGGKITPSPEPTKTPDSSPPSPVTPAPTSIPPDISEKIDSWNEMRKKAQAKKILTMTAVAGACLKEAVSNWWDDVMDDSLPLVENNKYASEEQIGYYETSAVTEDGRVYHVQQWAYNSASYDTIDKFYCETLSACNNTVKVHDFKTFRVGELPKYVAIYRIYEIKYPGNSREPYYEASSTSSFSLIPFGDVSSWKSMTESYHSYIPYVFNGVTYNAEDRPLTKSALWGTPDIKQLLDNTKKSPDLPVPVSIQLPNIDEIKGLNKDVTAAPTIIM